MPGFNCNKVLPNELVIDSIDDYLYEIGLCHHLVSDRTKRSNINSPKLIFIVLLFNLILSFLPNFTDDETTLILLTDFGHYNGIKFFVNIQIILISCMALFNQLVYYLNYKRGIEPTFLRVFQVLSGSLPPSAVGLTDESQVNGLLKIGKWLRPLHYNTMILFPLFLFCFILRAFLSTYDLKYALIYGTHTMILLSFWAYIAFKIIIPLLHFFIIICRYSVVKLIDLNTNMKNYDQNKIINKISIRKMLYSYNYLYREINEYNTTYWSKFLFSVWLFFGVILVFAFYLMLFSTIPIISKIIIFNGTITLSILYIFIMTIASSVNLEANKSYKIFNSFIVKYGKLSKLGYRQLTIINLKVIHLLLLL